MRKLQKISLIALASTSFISSIISTPIHASTKDMSLVDKKIEEIKVHTSILPASYLDEHLLMISDLDAQINEEIRIAEEKARMEAERKEREEKERLEKIQKEKEEAEAQQRRAQQTRSYTWNGSVLTPAAGVNYGPSGKETYYNLPMQGVVSIMRGIGNTDEYWVREDGVKMLGNYIMVAADLSIRPRGSLVETSLGTGIVCDTGTFIYDNPTQLDIAVAW